MAEVILINKTVGMYQCKIEINILKLCIVFGIQKFY